MFMIKLFNVHYKCIFYIVRQTVLSYKCGDECNYILLQLD